MKSLPVTSLALVLALFSSQQVAIAENKAIRSLKSLDAQSIFLGDVLSIGSGSCWKSDKPGTSLSRIRLQIFEGTKWKPVGKVKFLRELTCPKKYPFEQVFIWEVDRIGIPSKDYTQYGELRLRNRVNKPTIYIKIDIFESVDALEDWRQQRTLEAGDILMCTISGGQWDSQSKFCRNG